MLRRRVEVRNRLNKSGGCNWGCGCELSVAADG